MRYLLSIDQSTSATKAVLFNQMAALIDSVSFEHRQYYPQPEWVEHDPVEIYNNTVRAVRQVVENNAVNRDEIAALAITNQRETVVVWDKQSGQPVYNAVVWQCRRGAQICKGLREAGYEDFIRERTGLVIDPYFSASGVQWIMENVQGVKELAEQHRLAIGTIDSWLIFKLTGGRNHATDHTNASRTLLFNIVEKKWDTEILSLFHIPRNALPEALPCNSLYGKTTLEGFFSNEIPITGVMGDSHAALFGQHCFETGMAKATYGTGSSIMMNIGSRFRIAPQGVVTSIGYSLDHNTTYVFEGNIHCTGATIKWLKDDLQLISSSEESETLAASVENNNGVYLVPAFAGLGAPYWDNEANALLCGMNRSAKKAHIVRAALESIAYQIKDLLDVMSGMSGIELTGLRVDGGPTRNEFLMQFQSDMLNTPINRAEITETSALGVALMAGLSLRIWNNTDEIKSLGKKAKTYVPEMDEKERSHLYNGWIKAVKRTLLKVEGYN